MANGGRTRPKPCAPTALWRSSSQPNNSSNNLQGKHYFLTSLGCESILDLPLSISSFNGGCDFSPRYQPPVFTLWKVGVSLSEAES